jgi:phage FluMu protein Com
MNAGEVNCKKCGKSVVAEEILAGESLTCPSCKTASDTSQSNEKGKGEK